MAKTSSLEEFNPPCLSEWDYDKNNPLTPRGVTRANKQKVWWICSRGHSYQASVNSRTRLLRPTGCPYCSGCRVTEENSLQANFPAIANEWDYARNNPLTPRDVTKASRKNVWWICPKGHSYEKKISARTAHSARCSYCWGRKGTDQDSLLTKFPEIAKEWDFEKRLYEKPSG